MWMHRNVKNTIHFSAKCALCYKRTTSLCEHIKSMLHTWHIARIAMALSLAHLLSSQSHAFVSHRFSEIIGCVCGIWSVLRLLCLIFSHCVVMARPKSKVQYIFIRCARCVCQHDNWRSWKWKAKPDKYVYPKSRHLPNCCKKTLNQFVGQFSFDR